MNSLIRTKQGKFKIEDSIELDDIKSDTKLLTSRNVLIIKDYEVDEKLYNLVINGNKLNLNLEDGYYNVTYNNKDVALYNFKYNEGRVIMFY